MYCQKTVPVAFTAVVAPKRRIQNQHHRQHHHDCHHHQIRSPARRDRTHSARTKQRSFHKCCAILSTNKSFKFSPINKTTMEDPEPGCKKIGFQSRVSSNCDVSTASGSRGGSVCHQVPSVKQAVWFGWAVKSISHWTPQNERSL